MYAPNDASFAVFIENFDVKDFILTELFQGNGFQPQQAAMLFHHIQRQEPMSIEAVKPFSRASYRRTCCVNLLIDELLSGATEGRSAAVTADPTDESFGRLAQGITDLRLVMELCPYLNVVVTSLGGLRVTMACSQSKTPLVFLTGSPLQDADDCVRVFMAHMARGVTQTAKSHKRMETVSHLIQLCAGHAYTVARAGEMFRKNPDATACDVLRAIAPKPWTPIAMCPDFIVRGLLGLSSPQDGFTVPAFGAQKLSLDWFQQHGRMCAAAGLRACVLIALLTGWSLAGAGDIHLPARLLVSLAFHDEDATFAIFQADEDLCLARASLPSLLADASSSCLGGQHYEWVFVQWLKMRIHLFRYAHRQRGRELTLTLKELFSGANFLSCTMGEVLVKLPVLHVTKGSYRLHATTILTLAQRRRINCQLPISPRPLAFMCSQ